MTQSIIVYRNPLEAALWEGGMVFPIISGCFVGFITFLILLKFAEFCAPRRGGIPQVTDFVMGSCGIIALCLGVLTCLKMI